MKQLFFPLMCVFSILLLSTNTFAQGALSPKCDSCLMKIESLDQPVNMTGNWLFTRDDEERNKEVDLDTSAWKVVKAPGPWKKVYGDGKVFKVGWYRGVFEFNPELIGQKVTFLVDLYMGKLQVYLDGQEIYRRGENNKYARYYSIQPIPVQFTITQPRHVIAFRVDTILMTGVYQLPFQLRAFNQDDSYVGLFHIWGGEIRMLAAHVLAFFGLFFTLVYWKTRYPIYLVAAWLSLFVYPFYGFPGEVFLQFFEPEHLLILHYVGIAALAPALCTYAQFFYKFYRKINLANAAIYIFHCVVFSYLAFNFNLAIFQELRTILFLYTEIMLMVTIYIFVRAILDKRKGSVPLLLGSVVMFASGAHDILLALGKIDSVAMVFSGALISTVSILWVTSNIFADTFVQNKQLVGELKGMNDHLEDLVEERTLQLRQKTNDVLNMLEHLPEGILTLTKGNLIHHEYSHYLEEILEAKNFADKNVMEVLFKDSDLGSDTLNSLETSLHAIIGEDEMNFELNQHLLVQEFKKTLPSGKSKILELTWSSICDDNDCIDKIMISARDVTELRKLREAASEQKRELEIVGQILAVSQEKFHEFIQSSEEFIGQNKQLIETHKTKDPEVLSSLFRNMHTIKGNARTYALLHLTNIVHETEQEYSYLQKEPDREWDQQKLLAQLGQVEKSIHEYARINEQKLGRKGPGRRGNVEKYLMVKKESISNAIQYLSNAEPNSVEQLNRAIQNANFVLAILGTEKLNDIISGVIDSIPALAQELEKATPQITINDNGIHIRNQAFGLLRNVFMHIFRNSLDHGIEVPEVRKKSGKSPEGHIQLDLQIEEDKLVLNYKDDGRGLGIGRIREKAIAKKLISETDPISNQEIANLIFDSGLSTAEKVTEVSGRGVGMDAVKKFVQQAKGEIVLELDEAESSNPDFVPFHFILTLPANLAVQALGDMS
ncbi:ATP-binding protein [Deltaproteobacteria bacterium TL4]